MLTKTRKVPFGYEISDGEIVINNDEANIVKDIFTEYANGSSLSLLIKTLNYREVDFNGKGACWNKGRLYHILTEQRYLGNDVFPQIISNTLFDKANSLRNCKSAVKTDISDEAKYIKSIIFCGKCGSHIIRRVGKQRVAHWACLNGCRFGIRFTDEKLLFMLQKIIDKIKSNPDILNVATNKTVLPDTLEIMRLKNELIRFEEEPSPSFPVGKRLVFKLAAARFALCEEDKNVYTDYIKERILNVSENGADKELLKSVVEKIKVYGKDKMSVVFKNGAEITNSEEAVINERESSDENRCKSAPCEGQE